MENWYYVKQGEREGPVSKPHIEGLLNRNEIDSETLVWNEDMENWKPASDIFGAPDTVKAPPPPPPSDTMKTDSKCAECGMIFPEGELSILGGKPTCRRCHRDTQAKIRTNRTGRPASGHSPARKDNPMAMIGLILSISGILCCCFTSIPGLICSIIGHKNASDLDGSGKDMALAGIIVAAIITLFGVGSIIVALTGWTFNP